MAFSSKIIESGIIIDSFFSLIRIIIVYKLLVYKPKNLKKSESEKFNFFFVEACNLFSQN